MIWVQRHAARDAARDSGVHDPLLGNGDPYGVQEDPSSAHHAPTPAVVIAGLASELPLPCCIQPLQLRTSAHTAVAKCSEHLYIAAMKCEHLYIAG